MSKARKITFAIGSGLLACAGVTGLMTSYPHVALGILAAGTFCVGLATNLPSDPPVPPPASK